MPTFIYRIRDFKCQSGYSLAEIIIALAISLSLVFVVLGILISIRQTYQFNESLLTLQQNAVIASQLLARDIRSAGFFGCARLDNDLLQQLASHAETHLVNGVQGFNSANFPAASHALISSISPNTDVIVLEKMAEPVLQLNAIKQQSLFDQNEWLIIADCEKATVVRCPATHANAAELDLVNKYAADAQIGALVKVIYYIGNTGRKNTHRQIVLALYRKNMLSTKQEQTELVDNIENMQIRYGIQSLNTGEVYYVSAPLLSDWKNVVSVQIHLLMVSPNEITAKQQYQFMNSTWSAPDRRLRFEWITTIALRNGTDISSGVFKDA